MSHPRIKLIGTTMTHEDMRHVDAEFDRDSLAKVISTIIVAGFNENSLPNKTLDRVVKSVADLGELLGKEVNLDAKYDGLARMRPIFGLLYIANIAQSAAFGLLTRDPVASLALADTWNGLHSNIVSSEELSEEQQARLLSLLDIDSEGMDPLQDAENRLDAYNASGCTCGRDHGGSDDEDAGEPRFSKAQMAEMSSEELLATLPPELRPMIGLIAVASGQTEGAIISAVRDAFLEDRDPSEVLLGMLRGKGLTKPALEDLHLPESIKLGATDDPVEKIYQASVPALNKEYQRKFSKNLSETQLAQIRQQLEDQRAEIEAGARAGDGNIQAVSLKVPRE